MGLHKALFGVVIALVILAGLSFAEGNTGFISLIADSEIAQTAITACTNALDNLGIINEKREQAGLDPIQPAG
jgi:hypothetical protein